MKPNVGQQVPCMFNNNDLLTLAKCNYLPYGVDYPQGPTGRFCNGKNIPDFLVEFLGFEKAIPPFATANGSEILKGVNYASGGGGILDYTGILQGDRIGMKRQLHNHGVTISKTNRLLGNETKGREHLKKCLYVVNMGSNEYVNNYLLSPLYLTSLFQTPQQFAETVINHYSQQLKSLYNYGARKIAVYGLAPLGCIPKNLYKIVSNGSICNNTINEIVQPFNNRLKPLIDSLNADLHGSHFTMINFTSLITQGHNSALLGIKFTNASCCTVSKISNAREEICSNRNDYFFWDNYHLTEIGNRAAAARSYRAELPSDAYPFDIRSLVHQ
ncbi:GDSL esterase/lipase At1g29670-like [Salvia hispanica]|uniref:GDSL esterase/lipase At1g29670-like n=1 Tax=Salvia hispanica TaxID=49212 RepID=UPI0020097CEE|nr:GDSL esterase/lipase At1g29670-like [Salvia hispanica]